MPLFDAILEKRNYSEETARQIVCRLLSALSYLHEKNVSHRDLKPENMIFNTMEDDSELKILDFGSSSSTSEEELLTEGVGTLGYKAPELIIGGEKCSTKVDMWSLGVITYILLCGFPPFFSDPRDKENDDQLLNAPFWFFFNSMSPELTRQILAGDYSFPDKFWGGISREAKDFVSNLIVVDVEKRMSAAEALKHDWISGKHAGKGVGNITARYVMTERLERASARLSRFQLPINELESSAEVESSSDFAKRHLSISENSSFSPYMEDIALATPSKRLTLVMAQQKWTKESNLSRTVSFAVPGGDEWRKSLASLSQMNTQNEPQKLASAPNMNYTRQNAPRVSLSLALPKQSDFAMSTPTLHLKEGYKEMIEAVRREDLEKAKAKEVEEKNGKKPEKSKEDKGGKGFLKKSIGSSKDKERRSGAGASDNERKSGASISDKERKSGASVSDKERKSGASMLDKEKRSGVRLSSNDRDKAAAEESLVDSEKGDLVGKKKSESSFLGIFKKKK